MFAGRQINVPLEGGDILTFHNTRGLEQGSPESANKQEMPRLLPCACSGISGTTRKQAGQCTPASHCELDQRRKIYREGRTRLMLANMAEDIILDMRRHDLDIS